MENNFDLAPCIYFQSLDDRTIIYVNEQLCAKSGYSREELTGKKIDVLFTIATSIFYQTHFFPLLKMQRHAEEIFISLKTKEGGNLPVLINAERRQKDGQEVTQHIGIIVYNREKFEQELITARKTAEKALRENTDTIAAKEQLQRHTEQLERHINLIRRHNEQLLQFNRIVTHDMQEPLRKLSVFSNMMQEEPDLSAKKNIAQKVHRVTQQMRDVIGGLQQYVWLNDSEMQLTEIDLKNILLIIKQKAEQEHHIAIELDTTGDAHFFGDWKQMLMLFKELFANAIRFRKEPERVSLSVAITMVQLNRFRHVAERYEYVDYVRISIKDEGLGFDNRFRDQAFELFRRLHPESGSGVGLALCKKIIDNHNGDIFIEGMPGKETIVTLQVPVTGITPDPKDRLYLISDTKFNEHERG